VVWQAPDGAVWLFYVTRYGETWSTSRIAAKISRDGARTWSDSFPITFEEGTMVRGHPIALRDGDYLLPIYYETGHNTEFTAPTTCSLFLRFDPAKRTWTESNRVHSRLGNLQPAVAQIDGQHLIAYCRRGGDYEPRRDGFLVRTESSDGGRTWTEGKETDFPNPNSAVDLIRLKNGHLLLVYNDSMNERAPLTAQAGQAQEVKLAVKEPNLVPGTEYFLKVSFRLAADASWAPAGFPVAFDQLAMPYKVPPAPGLDTAAMPSLRVSESSAGAEISNGRFTARFGKSSGSLESYVLDGKEMIAGPLVPNYWRSETDNDRGNGMARRQGAWHDAGAKRSVTSITIESVSPKLARVTVDASLPAGDSKQRIVYSVYSSGAVEVESVLKAAQGQPDLPRVGLQFRIPGEFRSVSWFGRGPQESFWDRNTSAAVGLYSSRVDDMWYPYPRPQETGNRTDSRWAAFSNAQGLGWKITGLPTFDFSAWPFRPEEIDHFAPSVPGRKHPTEIVFSDDITVNVDYRQMGIGGDDGWGARPHTEYTLPAAREYRYKFRMEPVAPAAGRAKLAPMAN
jgi:hypothetical protein